MIPLTQKKLREAGFFLNKLSAEGQQVVRSEQESFEFYLSAFLSSARAVTFALQKEQKEKYDAWFPRLGREAESRRSGALRVHAATTEHHREARRR
jgi:hypothetical protein